MKNIFPDYVDISDFKENVVHISFVVGMSENLIFLDVDNCSVNVGNYIKILM
jgi:hypothetical protein